jgi:hypothetical protein
MAHDTLPQFTPDAQVIQQPDVPPVAVDAKPATPDVPPTTDVVPAEEDSQPMAADTIPATPDILVLVDTKPATPDVLPAIDTQPAIADVLPATPDTVTTCGAQGQIPCNINRNNPTGYCIAGFVSFNFGTATNPVPRCTQCGKPGYVACVTGTLHTVEPCNGGILTAYQIQIGGSELSPIVTWACPCSKYTSTGRVGSWNAETYSENCPAVDGGTTPLTGYCVLDGFIAESGYDGCAVFNTNPCTDKIYCTGLSPNCPPVQNKPLSTPCQTINGNCAGTGNCVCDGMGSCMASCGTSKPCF